MVLYAYNLAHVLSNAVTLEDEENEDNFTYRKRVSIMQSHLLEVVYLWLCDLYK